MKKHALLVGINRYEDPGITPLTCAEKDALALEYVLRDQAGFITRSLCGSQASRRAVLEALRDLCAGLGPEDVFLFYFSGHGHDDVHTTQQVLLPHDVSLPDLEDHSGPAVVPVRGVEAATGRSGCARFLVLDACRTPLRAGTKDSQARMSEAGARDIDTLVRREAAANPPLVTLCSCSAGQRAYELARPGRGAFSLAFEEVLRIHLQTGREFALPGVAHDALTRRVHALLKEHGRAGHQDPTIANNRPRVVLLGDRSGPGPVATGFAVVYCPVCDRANPVEQTFRCRECQTVDLCLQHRDPEEQCCAKCATARKQQRARETAARQEAERQEAARREQEQRERERAAEAEARRKDPSRATKETPWENGLGMRFVPVPGTEVLFSIWETRVQDYGAFVKATGRKWEKVYFEQGPTHPAVNVSWEDAQAFCTWLTETERQAGRLPAGWQYRLPTDAEWSWAVGIGDREKGRTPQEKDEKLKDVYPWGTGWPPPQGAGNYGGSLGADDFEYTSPVGSFAANGLGLYDLGGNVWEWCEDFFNGKEGSRVLRGGSWFNDVPVNLLSSFRINFAPDFRIVDFGFRVVLGEDSAR